MASTNTKEPGNICIRDYIQEEDDLDSKLSESEDADDEYIRIVKQTTLNPEAEEFAPTTQDSLSEVIPEDVDITEHNSEVEMSGADEYKDFRDIGGKL